MQQQVVSTKISTNILSLTETGSKPCGRQKLSTYSRQSGLQEALHENLVHCHETIEVVEILNLLSSSFFANVMSCVL